LKISKSTGCQVVEQSTRIKYTSCHVGDNNKACVEMKNNTLRRTAIISLAVAAIFAVMIFVPEAVGIDGFDGGFAFSFVSLLVALTAGGVSIFYFKQAFLR